MKRYKSSIYHKILFTISLVILFIIGIITVKHIRNLSDSSKSLIHTYEVTIELEHLYSYIKSAEIGVRGYLISKDTLYLKSYRKDIQYINTALVRLERLSSGNPLQQNNLKTLQKIINQRQRYFESYFNFNNNFDVGRNATFKMNFNESSILLAKIRDEINGMIYIENCILKQRNSFYHNQIFLTPLLTGSILFITLSIIIFTYFKTTKEIERVHLSNIQLNKSQFLSYQAEILSEFGTWEWSLTTNIITYSDNLYRILGVQPHSFEASQVNFMKYVHPEDVSIVNQIFERITTNESLPHSYFRIIRPAGTIRFLRSVGKLFVDNLGNKTILGVTEDITNDHDKNELLKGNYQDLMEVNNQLKIFEKSSKQAEILGKYGSWLFSLDTKKFIYSDNKFRLLGHEPQSFKPSIEKFFEFIHPEDKHIVENAYKKAKSSMSIPIMRYKIIRQDGKIRFFKTIGKFHTDSKGQICIIGTTQDVTGDYNKSLQLKLRNKELEKNILELNEFNQVASHDLQEPLRKIQTFISRINDKDIATMTMESQEYLTRIEIAANRMRVLINDLLQYSKANRTDKNLIPVDLNEILSNSLIELSQHIEDQKAVIHTVKLPTIDGIPFQMQQLFTNLLSNSLKYSNENDTPTIAIDCSVVQAKTEALLKDRSLKKYYKIIFKDNGIGFDQKYAEKIFLLFNRLHSKTDYQGTGVGLAICKKIVENHLGHIFASGMPNEGATFIIYLPLPARA